MADRCLGGGGTALRVGFYGVRGSCPCSGEQYVRYGGNTSCVSVEVGGEAPIVLDLGTGLRPLGHELEERFGLDAPIQLTAFLTHLHWDHIIGLPFCRPLLRLGGTMEVYGPPQGDTPLCEVIDRVVVPPFFPVQVKELHGSITFSEVADDVVAVGSAKVTVRRVPHVGTTLGFRIEANGNSVAYVSDHQAPNDLTTVSSAVLELCDGADLVIHDAQYTDAEFAEKATWGHSTVAYAVRVAAESGARHLVLYHHDPLHGDTEMDRLVDEACSAAGASRLDAVTAAAEGLSLELAPH
ncbi:MAG TPA: MBL fold metallo-hydrolase [Acidimicrobiaceae bacterium]|nr:MBL fold metallo-hydrolase [Acidimicrobiaceae bacterium]